MWSNVLYGDSHSWASPAGSSTYINNAVFWLRVRKSLCGRVRLESCLQQNLPVQRGDCPGTFQTAVLFCVRCRSSAASYWRSSERPSQRSSQRRWRRRGQNSWLTCAALSQLSTMKRAGPSCRPRRSEGRRFTGGGKDSWGRWIDRTDLWEECRVSFECEEWSNDASEDLFGIMQHNLQRRRLKSQALSHSKFV